MTGPGDATRAPVWRRVVRSRKASLVTPYPSRDVPTATITAVTPTPTVNKCHRQSAGTQSNCSLRLIKVRHQHALDAGGRSAGRRLTKRRRDGSILVRRCLTRSGAFFG
jgi:hypothetical protein